MDTADLWVLAAALVLLVAWARLEYVTAKRQEEIDAGWEREIGPYDRPSEVTPLDEARARRGW